MFHNKKWERGFDRGQMYKRLFEFPRKKYFDIKSGNVIIISLSSFSNQKNNDYKN